MEKLLLIVNPCAGQKKAQKLLWNIIDILNRADFLVQIHITASPGDGESAVLRYASEVDRIVCCGGDGTFNEVVSGLLKSGANIPLGYIPAGSTNDFASSLKMSGDLLQATTDAAEGVPVKLDVGCFNGRYFSYVASFGLFTKASYTTDNPNQQMAMVTHLSVNENFLFLLEDPAAFQERFELLTLPDGTYLADGTESTEPLWYSWARRPKLAQLPLGDYVIDLGGDKPLTGSNQQLLSKLYIGRATVKDWSQEQKDAYCQIWQNLIADTP